MEEAVTMSSHSQQKMAKIRLGQEDLRAPLDIQLPESLGGGLMDRSVGGSLDVRVEMEGSVWVV